ncbi:protein-tyrosine phosphatase-like protein [Usnea florida]
MSLDRIPGDANLYIGGLFSLRRKDALRKANITHVISVLRLPLDEKELFANFKHLVVDVDDVDDENIIEHFPTSNVFIREGLDGGGGVLVHCAMGKSRSTTILIAHLLSTNPALTPQSALDLIRTSRPFAEPNHGFMHQLSLYHDMKCPSTTDSLDNHPLYQRWLYRRTIEASLAAGVAPSIHELRFGDEGAATPVNLAAEEAGGEENDAVNHSPPPTSTYRCRRCRTPLATSAYLVPHHPKGRANAQPCAHLHLSPLSWMRPELELGKLEGRLECPNRKCGQSVGRYAWQGMKCSCGEWVVPGVTLGRGRIDEIKERLGVGGGGGKI